jgi:hypothetical protein
MSQPPNDYPPRRRHGPPPVIQQPSRAPDRFRQGHDAWHDYSQPPQAQYPPTQPQYGPPPQYGTPPQYAGNYPQQTYPPQNYPPAPAHHGAPPPKRHRRRVFLWVFLAIQAIFLIWIITGAVSTGHTEPSAAQMAQYCGNGPNSVLALYSSKADCMAHYSRVLSDAAGTGRGLGIALIVIMWFVVDVILGVSYGVYKLATRNR